MDYLFELLFLDFLFFSILHREIEQLAYQKEFERLGQQLEVFEKLEKKINASLAETTERRIQPKTIRCIQRYEFFGAFKHEWRKCQADKIIVQSDNGLFVS
ncbi:unnamed protein product [Paramecium octaurelia]|uniref:Uncharacterized protein n=1 Tax=Paramecium octaurelia TaxID=43137 RepID=A0A8S1TNE3_PAROT|nr:unnamed protein product [Paramecium octaurelia]